MTICVCECVCACVGLLDDHSHRSKSHVSLRHIPLIRGNPHCLLRAAVLKSRVTGIVPVITINNWIWGYFLVWGKKSPPTILNVRFLQYKFH